MLKQAIKAILRSIKWQWKQTMKKSAKIDGTLERFF